MPPPVGPSLQLMLIMADIAGEVTVLTAKAVWKRWFSSQRFCRKLAQFESQGWVERGPVREGSLDRAVRLTEAGREIALGGRDPEASWGRKWDGRWRLVLFDIPENQRTVRTRLSRGLRQLGFGYLQNSVWVSPDPPVKISGMFRGLKLDVESLSVMEARPCGGESDADLVNGAWDFPRINRDYEVYLEVLEGRPVRNSGRSWKTWIEVEWKAWNRALGGDPLLPVALLPAGYRGREAWKRRMAFLRRTFGQGLEDLRGD
ncbi:MAG TPA: hypothetical protein VIK52_05040 [Opitutaceae bacterium]